MQREIIKWVQSLDLSAPLKNPQRDLTSGVLAAEIVDRCSSRKVISLHSVTDGLSTESRRRNWSLIMAALNEINCQSIDRKLVEAVIERQQNAAETLLDHLYEFFSGKKLLKRSIAPFKDEGAYLNDENIEMTQALWSTISADTAAESDPTALQARLALTKNAELAAGGRKLDHTPAYARNTASTLVRQAEQYRQVDLLREKYAPDSLTRLNENTQILNEHERLKHVERKETEESDRKQKTLTSVLRGPYTTATHEGRRTKVAKPVEVVPVQEPQRIEVNVFNSSLKNALESRLRQNSGEMSDLRGFEPYAYSVREALTPLVYNVVNPFMLERAVRVSDEDQESIKSDALLFVLSHQESFPSACLHSVLVELEAYSMSIVGSILHDPQNYEYLLKTFRFMFSAESAKVPLLHVTSDCDHDPNQCDLEWQRSGTSVGGDRRAVYRNRAAFALASSFVFFAYLHKQVAEVDSRTASHMLDSFLTQCKSSLFPHGTAAVLEAISRIIMNSSPSKVEFCSCLATLQQLTPNVTTPVKRWEMPRTAQLGFQLDLLKYHCGAQAIRSAEDLSESSLLTVTRSFLELVYSCLASAEDRRKTLGLSCLLQLVNIDQLECFDDCFVNLGSVGRSHGGTLWECGAVRLELLSLLFQKVVVYEAKKSFDDGDGGQCDSLDRFAKLYSIKKLDGLIADSLVTFCSSPLRIRQLILNIVGSRLLPDFQPRTTRAWVALLTSSSKFFNFLSLTRLLPLKGTTSDEPHAGSVALGAPACEALPTVVLSGKVESTYVVSSVSQRWNTCGVVQAVLMYRSDMSLHHLFLVVAAALFSPQDELAQQSRLLHDLKLSKKECEDAGEFELTLRGLTLVDSEEATDDPSDGLREVDADDSSATMKAFWVSTFRRIRGELVGVLSSQSNTEETEDLKKVSFMILLTLFKRYGNAEPGLSGKDLITKALAWTNE